MIDEMRAELAELAARLERRNKIDAMLQSLTGEALTLEGREREFKNILAKEENDVSRLQRTSAASVFYAILGKKDIQLSKEQQEAYAARLKYDAAVRQLDDCRARIETLKQERYTLWDCAEAYDKVFATLQEELRHDPAYADRLCALERRRGEALSQLRELDEALSAGGEAMNQISYIENSLDSAASWGNWDLIGGGLLADIEKHSNLDEAQAGAEHLQVLLSRFRTELADVSVSADMGSISVDGFLRFADFFFDGLIADWTVLNRIHDSQESVCQVKCQVGDVLSRLNALKAARTAEKESLDKEIAELVANGLL